jgi:hypothetical protein
MTAIHEFKSNFFTILTHTRIKSIMCQPGYEKGYENHIIFGFSVRNLIKLPRNNHFNFIMHVTQYRGYFAIVHNSHDLFHCLCIIFP